MLDFPRWKIWATTLACLIGIAMAIPSFLPASAPGTQTPGGEAIPIVLPPFSVGVAS